MNISGILTLNDIKKANYYVKRKSEIYYFVFVILVFFFSYKIIIPDLSPGYVLFLSLLMAVIIRVIRWFLQNQRLRKEFASDQTIKNEVTYTISHEGIRQQRQNSSLYVEWKDVLFVYEHHELFRLHISKNKVLVIPKRFFHSNVDSFKEIVRQNVDSKKLKLN